MTTDTRFAVASTTTSMAAALEASYVGEGRLHGDQKVVDVWPGFRAPTDSLTRDLRVRDLLGMASGLSEPAPIQSHCDTLSSPQLVQSVVNLPVVACGVEPNVVYNNTLQTAGAGNCWNLAVLGPLLGERFRLNVTAVQTALDQNATSLAGLADVGRQARPVDLKQLERYLGHYQNGWSTVRDGRELQLLIGPRVIPLKVMPDVRTP